MVSFQCHVCGDVVKKPKLDQHRSRCYGGFDCIDCSTTFNTPTDYKGHTQCISEAEKYQKSLYKGPKTAGPAPRNNYPPLPPPSTAPPGRQWGGRGGFGGRGGRGGWGQPRSSATGANDTPLGTPARLSPVASPALTPQPAVVQQVRTPAFKAPTSAPSPAPMEAPTASAEKKKKDKKRKSTAKETTTGDSEPVSKKAKMADDTKTADPASVPLPVSPDGGIERKEKKSKKDKKDKKDKTRVKDGNKKRQKESGEDVEMSASAEEGTKKKKSKKEKEKAKDGEDVETSASAEEGTKKNGKKEKEKEKTVEPVVVAETEASEKSKKRKRKHEDEGQGAEGAEPATTKNKAEDAMYVDPSDATAVVKEKKTKKNKEGKEKRDKSEKKEKKEKKKEKKSKQASSMSAQ